MDNTFLFLFFILFISTIIVALPLIILHAKDNKKGIIRLKDCSISHELEFGGVYIKISISDFNKLGFEYGDSVNIVFSNGYSYRDVPYYNGYYTANGQVLLLGYPGSKYIKVAVGNGEDLWNIADLDIKKLLGEKNLLWDTANLKENTTVTITLAKKGKYLNIQKARDIHYFDEREQYETDEVFANFRSLTGGKLKKDYFYRSASPCDNQHNRAMYVDSLIKNAGVKFVINLADDNVKIKEYLESTDYNSPYFKSLYDKNNVELLLLNMNYNSKYFKGQIIKALQAIINNKGPFLIHCTEGKDRTGFVCMLIELLSGATYEEIVNDYMITYYNYYGISKTIEQHKYTVIVESVLNPMIKSVAYKKVDIKTANLNEYAKKYLLKNGMTKEQVDNLITKLTN